MIVVVWVAGKAGQNGSAGQRPGWGYICHFSVFSTAGTMGSPLSTAWYCEPLGTELSKPQGWQGQTRHIWKHCFVRDKRG